jgi:tetratricopeptide (TPR) repeat protein
LVVVICRIGSGRIVLAGVEDLLTRSRPAATVAQLVEVHRLAVAGREPEIARHVGDRVARVWLRTSRFADVEALATATLTLGPDAGALYDLGWAQSATGRPRQALDSYEQALRLSRVAGDHGSEAATLNNIGQVYARLGDRRQALAYYEQALPIAREVGDRAGEAVTLSNIGGVYDGLGDRGQALAYYEQALPILREVGDRAGEAATLNNISLIRFQEGDLDGARDALNKVLEVFRTVGDRGSEATVISNMAALLLRSERVDDAIEYQRRAVALAEETSHPSLDRMRAFLVELEQAKKG